MLAVGRAAEEPGTSGERRPAVGRLDHVEQHARAHRRLGRAVPQPEPLGQRGRCEALALRLEHVQRGRAGPGGGVCRGGVRGHSRTLAARAGAYRVQAMTRTLAAPTTSRQHGCVGTCYGRRVWPDERSGESSASARRSKLSAASSASQPAHTVEEHAMPTGTVKWFSDDKGFGFITPDDGDKDLFVHHTGINGEGYRSLQEGAKVSYDPEQGDKGPKAVNVDERDLIRDVTRSHRRAAAQGPLRRALCLLCGEHAPPTASDHAPLSLTAPRPRPGQRRPTTAATGRAGERIGAWQLAVGARTGRRWSGGLLFVVLMRGGPAGLLSRDHAPALLPALARRAARRPAGLVSRANSTDAEVPLQRRDRGDAPRLRSSSLKGSARRLRRAGSSRRSSRST